MSHRQRLDRQREFERELEFALEYYRAGEMAKRKERPTFDDKSAVITANRVVSWFEDKYEVEWESVLAALRGRAI